MAAARSRKAASGSRKHEQIPVWADIAIRFVLGTFFAFAAGFYFTNAFAHLKLEKPSFLLALDVLSVLAVGSFSFMVAYLYAIRLQAVNKFAGWGPAIISILGSFLLWSLLLLPQPAAVSPGLRLVGFCLVLGGNGFALYILYYLGQSFSILPESRELVTKGPYRYVRHPLYVAEAFSTIGVMIHFLSPAAAAIVAVQFVMQFIRIHYEEKVLRETFPDYAAYSRRTARLIPGIY